MMEEPLKKDVSLLSNLRWELHMHSIKQAAGSKAVLLVTMEASDDCHFF